MIIWNIKPEFGSLGPVTIRWYGLLFAAAFIFGFRISKKIFEKDGVGIAYLDRLIYYVGFGTIIGARLGHCLFYEPKIYLVHPLRILRIWEGGLASHGAAVGIILSLFIFSKKTKELSLLQLMDRVAIPIALAGGFIRLGNLFNSEIIGKPTSAPWAFVFPRVDNVPRHPTQLYESILYFLIFGVLYNLFKSPKVREARGQLAGVFFILIFSVRFFVEFLKENQVSFESALPLNLGQILSVPAVLIGVALVLKSKPSRNLKTTI